MSKDSLSELKAGLIKEALIKYGVGNILSCPTGSFTVTEGTLFYWFNLRRTQSTKILQVKIPGKYSGKSDVIV